VVAGSNPARRTIYDTNPSKPWFVEVLEYQNTTLLQLHKEFIETDTSYLQKIKNTYYLVYKYKKKIIKKSLGSSNLKYCNIKKLKLLRIIEKELGLSFTKIKSQLEFNITAGKDDDIEAVKAFETKMKEEAAKLFSNGKVKEIKTNNNKKISIEDAFNKFIENIKIKKNPREETLKNYKSAFSYIKVFTDTSLDISHMNNMFWDDLQSNLIKIPRDYYKTPTLVKIGVDSVIYNNESLKKKLSSKLKKISSKDKTTYDKVKKEYEKLILPTMSFTTINKHFSCYRLFMNYLKRNSYMENTLDVDTLDEEDSPKETFLYKELKELFNYKSVRSSLYEDSEYQNIFKFAFLTGMRRGEILKITKDSIVDANGILCIDIKEAKNKQSMRLVPISDSMKEIIKIQFEKSKNGYLFFDKEPRYNNNEIEKNIGKRLNRIIDKMLKDSNYVDKSVKSFHSLRGNCIQELYIQFENENIGSELYIKMLVGHKAIKNITFNTYNKSQVSLEILKKCIDTISLNLINNSVKENQIIKKVVDIDLSF